MAQGVGTHWGAVLTRTHVEPVGAVEHEIERDFGSTCLRHPLPIVPQGERGQYLCDR